MLDLWRHLPNKNHGWEDGSGRLERIECVCLCVWERETTYDKYSTPKVVSKGGLLTFSWPILRWCKKEENVLYQKVSYTLSLRVNRQHADICSAASKCKLRCSELFPSSLEMPQDSMEPKGIYCAFCFIQMFLFPKPCSTFWKMKQNNS